MEESKGFLGITFQNLWGLGKEKYAEDIIQVWSKYNLIPREQDAEDRVKQVVYLVKNNDNNIIGISTAYPAYIKQLRNHLFAYRCMLVPGHGVRDLIKTLTLETFKFLESIYEEENPRCIGIIAEIENKKLEQRYRQAVYPTSRLALIGYSERGNEVRVYYFKGVKL